jgi:hypothetical protein
MGLSSSWIPLVSERRRLVRESITFASWGFAGGEMGWSSTGGAMTHVEEPVFDWKAMVDGS